MNQVLNQLHRRAGAAPSNFDRRLPAADSELAQQLTRDPYVLDFLELTEPVAERDLETALVDRLQNFLLELGHGFAFVARQYHFEVDGDDFYIDLLFFYCAPSRFVVVELKIGRFQPEHAGQLGFYVSWVDSHLRDHDRHSPTIGILMCAARKDSVVRYTLAGAPAPLAVADYTYDTLPPPPSGNSSPPTTSSTKPFQLRSARPAPSTSRPPTRKQSGSDHPRLASSPTVSDFLPLLSLPIADDPR